jgi:hypothetical protein
MDKGLYSVLAGTAGLTVAALLALLLTFVRKPGDARPAARWRLVRIAALAVVLQSIHFVEELITGFYERFPALLGLRPWSAAFFVAFNLFWLVVEGLALVGLRLKLRAAFFPAWFLGLASVVNGVAHPLFSAMAGSYFPGLWSSPLVGVAGVLLLRDLVAFTQVSNDPLRAV